MDIYRQRKKTRWRGSRLVPRGGEVDQGPEKKWVKKDHPKEKRKTKNCSKTTQKEKERNTALTDLCPQGVGARWSR